MKSRTVFNMMHIQHETLIRRRQGFGGHDGASVGGRYDGKRAACPTNRTGSPRSPSAATGGGASNRQARTAGPAVPTNNWRWRDSRIKHAILPNEPTVFAEYFQCKIQYTKHLRPKTLREIGGFVFENEPTGEVFLGG